MRVRPISHNSVANRVLAASIARDGPDCPWKACHSKQAWLHTQSIGAIEFIRDSLQHWLHDELIT
eukprot:2511827-Amphidinium_carterae.1